MVLDKVAEERAIGVDQNDLTQHILRKAQADGVPPQQVADHLKEHPHHIEEYMLEIRRGKALALIVESATVTDSRRRRGRAGHAAARTARTPTVRQPPTVRTRGVARRRLTVSLGPCPCPFRTGARSVAAMSESGHPGGPIGTSMTIAESSETSSQTSARLNCSSMRP